MVSRREAVETVNDMVVGEGHKIVRWDRVVSIGLDNKSHLGLRTQAVAARSMYIPPVYSLMPSSGTG